MITFGRRWGLFVAMLTATALPAAALERLPRENLLVYRDEGGEVQPVTSLAEWGRRREEILRGMKTVMGKLPGPEKRVPLDVQVVEEVDGGTYVRRLITYVSEPGCRTPAYLLIPKEALSGRKKGPGVLVLHGTNMEVGHGSVVGIGKVQNRAYAPLLAERGFVVLAPNSTITAAIRRTGNRSEAGARRDTC